MMSRARLSGAGGRTARRWVAVALAGGAGAMAFLASATSPPQPQGGESEGMGLLHVDPEFVDVGDPADDLALVPEALAAVPTVAPFVTRAMNGNYQPPDIEQVEHLCALLTSCPGLPIPPSMIPPDFVSCVKQMTQELTSADAINFSLTIRECGLGAANTCDALKSCALRGAHVEACTGRGMGQNVVGFCDGDGRALSCWHGKVVAVRDCPRGDEQCVVDGGQSQCVLGPCPASIRPGSPAQCGAAGARVLQCVNGKLVSKDCGAFGLKCVQTPGGELPVACGTSSPACAAGSVRCDGNVAVGCHNGHEVRVSCADAGLVCNAGPGSTAIGACQAPARGPRDACNPNEAAKCGEKDDIQYCLAGKRSYPCKAFFNSCKSDAHGVHCAK